MGGKSTQSTSTVSIPPEVLARYNAVNAKAEQVAATPFQAYGGQFVAPINPTQQAGIEATSQYSQAAQPYYGAATGLALAGAAPVNPQQLQTGRYMSPYTGYVAGATQAALGQQQGQQLSQQQAEAIRAGAFGGDRAGIQRGVLMGQQGLATAQALAPIYQQGYSQALQTAQQQQGVGLQAQQANRQALQQAAQQVAGLGTGAQQAALQGAQAQIGAGTLAQQTQQAQDTAQYQQFLQERGYPFQVAQFLANIAMGTGALSGSTTTTTQPSSFFSDERLKENIETIGETFDGQPIYKYNYKGEQGTQIGLMAQDVEKHHPEAVGEARGFKTVDYDRATEEAAARGAKGLVPPNWMGGAVHEPGSFARGGYALSGAVLDPTDMKAILESNRQSLAPFAQAGLYGGPQGQSPMGGKGVVPPPSLATPRGLMTAAAPKPQESGFKQMMGELQSGQNMYESVLGEKGLFGEKGVGTAIGKKLGLTGTTPPANQNQGSGVAAGPPAKAPVKAPAGGVAPQDKPKIVTSDSTDRNIPQEQVGVAMPIQRADIDPSLMSGMDSGIMGAARGGQIHRRGYAGLGKVIDPMELQDPSKGVGAYIDDATESQDKPENLQTPGTGGGGGKSGGLGSDLMTAGNLAMMGAKAAPMVAEGFSALMAALPFSDARLKDNIRPVGKTYDGQNIYSYDMGDGRTQMGLMAQEVMDRKPEAVGQRDGFLTLDYDRATEDAAPRYRGGVAPRPHYALGGFEDSLKRTLGFEGGYAEDTGGPTMMGISSKANPDVDLERVKQDPEYRAGIYRERYWNPVVTENMDPKMKHVAFDTAVNLGVGRTNQLLQQAGDDPAKLLQLRQQHYDRLIQNDPETYGKYGKGWMNRLAGLSQDIGLEAPAGGVAPKKSWALRNLPTTTTPEGKEEVNLKQLLIPGLIGLGQMAASPSRYFGAAALQGLGAGAQAYANLEKQQADIERTLAEARQAKAGEVSTLSNIPASALIGEVGPDGRVTYKIRPDYFGGQLKGEAGGPQKTGLEKAQEQAIETGKKAVTGEPQKGDPLVIDTTGGKYTFNLAPRDEAERDFQSNFANLGYRGGSNAQYILPSLIGSQPALAAKAAKDQEQAQARVEMAANVPKQRMETNMMTDAVFGISPTGIAGQGPGQSDRARALAVYDWAVKFAGLPGLTADERQNQNITSAQIIEKLRQQMGPMQAGQYGFHGSNLAQAINDAQISGSLTPQASAKLAASMYVIQQEAQDFARYYDSYVKKYGSALNVRENFAKEMGQRYNGEKKLVEQAIMPVQRTTPDGKKELTSWYLELMKNPSLAKRFDQEFKTPGLARMFLGG